MKNIEKLFELINRDYANFMYNSGIDGSKEVADRMIKEFAESLRVEEGRKYIKVIKDNSVWGFIVKKDDDKFKAGDILKAAGWRTPARNRARGNVIEADFSWVRWTGPAYIYQ